MSSNTYSNFGSYERRLCTAAQDYVDAGVTATTVANATLGLVLALARLVPRNEARRQVLMPSFTFAAAPDAALLVGLQPVFIDIDPRTLELDIGQSRRYLAKHQDEVVSVVLCNPFGIGAESISDWEQFADDHSLELIIDSAAGFGSQYSDGAFLGGRGHCEVFSLHATKPFAVGEGGLITSRDESLIQSFRMQQNFGFGPERTVAEAGINAKLPELMCAIGLIQIERLRARIARRREIAAAFAQLLTGSGFVIPAGVFRSSVPFLPVLAPSRSVADAAFETMRARGVEVQRYYNPPLHRHPAFVTCPFGDTLEVTDDVCGRILSFPVHDGFTDHDVETICAGVAAAEFGV